MKFSIDLFEPGAHAPWLSALMTYGLHSTVWVVLTALLCGRRLGLAPAAAHRLWRLALVGPLGSTALALLWSPARSVRPWPLRAALPAPAASVSSGFEGSSLAFGESHAWAEPALSTSTSTLSAGSWLWLYFAAAGVWAALSLGRQGAARWAFRRRLRARRRVDDRRATAALERLRRSARLGPVRLSEHSALSSPTVLGRAEIGLPLRAAERLEPVCLEAALAHELAHIERRDELWLPLLTAWASLLSLQPLHRWVLGRLRETAELACDARAVQWTGQPRALARALAEVAGWPACPAAPVAVPGMARSKGLALRRVERLLEPPAAASRSRAGWALVVLIAFGACAPRLGGALAPEGAASQGASTAETVAHGTAADGTAAVGTGSAASSDPSHVPARASQPSAAAESKPAAATEPGGGAPHASAPSAAASPRQSVDARKRAGQARKRAAQARQRVAQARQRVAQARRQLAEAKAEAAGANAAGGLAAPARVPPLPPAGLSHDLAELLAELVPRATSRGMRVAELAIQEASLSERLASARRRLRRGDASARADVSRIKQQLVRARADRVRAEAELETWVRQIEGKAPALEARAEAWGREMEEWGEAFGREMEAWGEAFDRRMQERDEARREASPPAGRP